MVSFIHFICRKKSTKADKDLFQKEFPNVLPEISGILDQVNRQMLLILKTNDLIRGIEYTLKTDARMEAFRVMSQCCVKSVYGQKICKENSRFGRFQIIVAKYWALFKIKIYYTVLSFREQLSLPILGIFS